MGDLIEIRQYPMLPGRFARFHDLMGGPVPGLFARHGFAALPGCWESHAGPLAPALIYGLRWSSLAARDAAWAAFYSDPDWLAALQENFGGSPRVDHAHVSLHLALTADPGSPARADAVWSELTCIAAPPDAVDSQAAIIAAVLPGMMARGGALRGVWRALWGRPHNEVTLLIDWPDEGGVLADPVVPPGWRLTRQVMRALPYLWSLEG